MMRGTTVRPYVAERMVQTAPCFSRVAAQQQVPSRSSTGQPTPRGHMQNGPAVRGQSMHSAPAPPQRGQSANSMQMPQQIGSWEGPPKGMRQLSPRVQKVATPQSANARSISAEGHPSLLYGRGSGSGRWNEGTEQRSERASTVDPLGQAFSRQPARHSACSPSANLRGGCNGQSSARKDRPPSANASLGPLDEEEETMDAIDRGREVRVTGMSGSFKPRNGYSHKSASPSPQSSAGGQAQHEGSRLQFLESELALFTSKMTEMRTVAEALQEEIQISRPSPTSSVTTGTPTPTGTPSFASAGDVIEALKKVLSKEKEDSERASFRPMHLQTDLAQEVRQLHQQMKLEAEARKQLSVQMESMFQEEGMKRDEMEKCLQRSLKEELALHRAVEGSIEGRVEDRIAASMREVRLESGVAAAAASAKAQQVMSEFNQLRESLRQEINAQKLEIGNASMDLSRLIDEVRQAGISGDVLASVTSTEMTENLVRAEVRRQLAERWTDNAVDDTLTLEMQALASRLDLLERSLENEITSRQQEGSKFLCEMHALMKEQGEGHSKAFQEFEEAFKSKLDSMMKEVQITRENCLEEGQVRRQQISQETKDREETAVRILRAVEEKILLETKHCRQALVDQQGRLEDFVTNHGQAINKMVERNSQELETARNDVLQLRDELKEVREDYVLSSPRYKGKGGASLERSLDIEELRTQMATERLAREQGDDRCMDNIRDLINEEQGKRGRELQALELRLGKKEVCQTSGLANRPTTSICQTGGRPTMPPTATMIQVQGATTSLPSFSA